MCNGQFISSLELADAMKNVDFTNHSATVIGYGTMGHHYVQALRSLGVSNIRVVSRSSRPLEELFNQAGISTISEGYRRLDGPSSPDDLAIVATPTADLIPASMYLLENGFRKILIEKPVSLWSREIREFASICQEQAVDVVSGFNRAVYPTVVETRSLALKDGGITSCSYEFTELVDHIGPEQFTTQELSRWGVANSLHVVSMAHALIGNVREWHVFRTGKAVNWHSTESTQVGSGVTESGIPFVFYGDWGSKGRWSVEVRTSEVAYKLCPLEKLFVKTSSFGEWEEVSVAVFDDALKMGIAEEIAAMFNTEIRSMLPIVTLDQAAQITSFGEDVFGYPESK